jgi:hypothetical protein
MKDVPSTSDSGSDSDPDSDSPFQPSPSALESGRYASLQLDNGEYVIYDRDDDEAWLQSDLAVEVAA